MILSYIALVQMELLENASLIMRCILSCWLVMIAHMEDIILVIKQPLKFYNQDFIGLHCLKMLEILLKTVMLASGLVTLEKDKKWP